MDEFEDDLIPESETLYSYTFSVSICRFMGTLLYPSRITMTMGLNIIDEEDFRFALLKVKHWIDNNVAQCIVVSAQNPIAFDALLDGSTPRFQNSIMITPGEPSDPHLLHLFQSKIEAIADEAFIIDKSEIKSDNADGLMVTYYGDGAEELPDMEQWIAGPNWFKLPWWRRNDISMLDTNAPEGTDLSVLPDWAGSFDFLRSPDSPPAIVLRGNFVPKVIDAEGKNEQ